MVAYLACLAATGMRKDKASGAIIGTTSSCSEHLDVLYIFSR